MNETTYTRRSNKLLNQIVHHPHKDELLYIMYQQIQDELNTPTNLFSKEI